MASTQSRYYRQRGRLAGSSECGCLGAAILAGLGVGEYSSVDEAVELLVAEVDLFQPDMNMHEQYAQRFAVYSELYPALKDVTHKM